MTLASVAEVKALLWSAPGRRSALKKLYVQVLIAIALGVLLGAVYPSLATDMKPFSDGFITLIRAVVPLIIFAAVAVGIAKIGICAESAWLACGRSSISRWSRRSPWWSGLSLAICGSLAPACTSRRPRWTKRRFPATCRAPNR